MELEHTFTVPVPVDEAFRVLRDIERIGPCMPGATIDSVDGDEFSGKVKVKVGPIQVTYQGTAAFIDVDEASHTATIEAKAKEARGSGTAAATIRAACTAQGDETSVTVVTELAITGKPAQFGRGVMADVGDKLLGRFADCLSEKLAEGDQPDAGDADAPAAADATPADAATDRAPAAAAAASGATAPAAAPPRPAPARQENEAIDLFDVAGGSVAKRFGPGAAAVAVVLLVVWLIRRR